MKEQEIERAKQPKKLTPEEIKERERKYLLIEPTRNAKLLAFGDEEKKKVKELKKQHRYEISHFRVIDRKEKTAKL
jgi:hypothetical protein